jgi:hypothetical protein
MAGAGIRLGVQPPAPAAPPAPYVPVVPRWVCPVHGGVASTSQKQTVARAHLVQVQLPVRASVDAVVYIVGSPAAGAVRAAIYGPLPTGVDTAAGLPLIVESASVTQGTANGFQAVAVAATTLLPGRYYVALQFSSASGRFMRQSSVPQAPGLVQHFDVAGGYGPFPGTVPAVTEPVVTPVIVPGVLLRASAPA